MKCITDDEEGLKELLREINSGHLARNSRLIKCLLEENIESRRRTIHALCQDWNIKRYIKEFIKVMLGRSK